MASRRKTESSLKAIQRSTTITRGKKRKRHDEGEDEKMTGEGTAFPTIIDKGPVRSLAPLDQTMDVVESIQHIISSMFDDIPQRAGMNSVRISTVLNFRKNLPPVATISHVHALSRSPTAAEREIATLVQTGVLRRLKIPGRGLGSTAIGDYLVLADQWAAVVNSNLNLTSELKDKYLTVLRENPTTATIKTSTFSTLETSRLIQAGFLTSTTLSTSSTMSTSSRSTGQGNLSALASAGTRAPTGSVAAVGGAGAVHAVGGTGVGASRQGDQDDAHSLSFSLPSVGLYLRLLAAAREHLATLLSKSRYREAPLDLLRERWDGGVASEERPKLSKGLQASVPPARTRKWKQYYGIRFRWILEECFGTGAIELFETGSVGIGARVPG